MSGELEEKSEITTSVVVVTGTEPPSRDQIEHVTGVQHWSWKGVRNCCSQERVDAEALEALNFWLAETIKVYPAKDWLFIKAEGSAGQAHCRQSGGSPGGRHCNGILDLPVWADFARISA